MVAPLSNLHKIVFQQETLRETQVELHIFAKPASILLRSPQFRSLSISPLTQSQGRLGSELWNPLYGARIIIVSSFFTFRLPKLVPFSARGEQLPQAVLHEMWQQCSLREVPDLKVLLLKVPMFFL